MRGPLHRLMRCDSGASAVEFAVVSPMIFVIILGLLDVGNMLWVRHTLQYGAELAGRYAMVNRTGDETTLTAQVQNSLPPMPSSDVTISVTQDTQGGITYVTIAAQKPYTPLYGLVGMTPVALTGRAVVPLISG